VVFVLCLLVAEGSAFGQKAPAVPDHPWDPLLAKQPFKALPPALPPPVLDPAKVYTLSELVDIAEQNNPETRVAWENAKAKPITEYSAIRRPGSAKWLLGRHVCRGRLYFSTILSRL
jgi:hypothetical protein